MSLLIDQLRFRHPCKDPLAGRADDVHRVRRIVIPHFQHDRPGELHVGQFAERFYEGHYAFAKRHTARFAGTGVFDVDADDVPPSALQFQAHVQPCSPRLPMSG